MAKHGKDDEQIGGVVSHLKYAIAEMLNSSKGKNSDLDQYLETLTFELEAEEHVLKFSDVVKRFEQKRREMEAAEAELIAEERADLTKLLIEVGKRSLSTTQLDKLEHLIKVTEDPAAATEHVLMQFAVILNDMSEELEVNRHQARIVVDSNHAHIQQNNANIVAADVQTASKRLTREIAHISQRMSESFPDNGSLLSLRTEAEEIQNKPNQFFKALDLLQETNRHVSQIIQIERYQTQEILKTINEKFSGIVESSLELDSHFSEGNDETKKLNANIKSHLTKLKKQADESGSVEDLRRLMDENAMIVSNFLEGFTQKQARLALKNKNAIGRLSREVKEANQQLKRMKLQLDSAQEDNLIDELSKTGNRKGYLKHMETAYSSWRMKKQSLSLIVLDIDRFKTINDKYGHSVGDQIIRKIGSILQDCVRESDYVARYGGEEFIVVCNGATGKEAARLAEDIRKQIAKRSFRLREQEERIRITASFGIADFTDERYKITSVFDAADHALYSAKRGGRNRVMLMDGAALVSLR